MMKTALLKNLFAATIIQVTVLSASATEEAPLSAQIDQLAHELIETYRTPGLAIAVVKDGAVVHATGYGKRTFNEPDTVNTETFFRVASVTKAFTAALIATLVDDGKLNWDDKVIDYLPNFQMADPWVTREFTIRDLFTHRSGLGPGAGDLMLWPAPAGFSRDEIIHNLRFLKPVSSFRSEYAYDNLLYIVAGEIAAKVSGTSWENSMQQRVLSRLDNNCYSEAPKTLRNVATPHQITEGKLETVPRNAVTVESPVYAAAGGISCNISGLADWMLTWLAGGSSASGQKIFSEEQRDEMWRGVTLMQPSRFERDLMNTNFKSYALGWRKIDAMGHMFISHTGSLSGARAWVGMIPELNIGIAILDNGNNSRVRNILMTALLAKLTGQPDRDWATYIANWYDQQQQSTQTPEEIEEEGKASVFLPLEHYAGAYKDNWFGWVDIKLNNGQLRFISRKSKHMKGTLVPSHGNSFIVQWDNRSFEADAWAKFDDDFDGKIIGMRMKAVSDEADSSFDFQDLDFAKQQ
ncbi:MAG: serine hydrolase [Kordiimonas sp.]